MSANCQHVRRFERVVKQLERDDKRNEEIRLQEIAQFQKEEPKEWNMSPAPAKYDVKNEVFYLVYTSEDKEIVSALLDKKEVNYSIGCKACHYELDTVTRRSLRKYASWKGFYLKEEDIDDAISEALEYIMRKPKRWNETLKKAQESKRKIPPKGAFCRLARSKLKNLIRSYVQRQEITLIDQIAPDKSLNSQLQREESEFKLLEIADTLKTTLTQEQCNLLARRIEGYTLKEIATMQAKTHQAIQQKEQTILKQLRAIEIS